MMAIELRISPPRPCGRCEREGLLTVDVPNSWIGGRQQLVSGMLPVVLCGHCDQDAPGAGALITFLVVHERISDELTGQFAEYVQAWVRQLKVKPNPSELAEDEAAWRRGEYE
jgi:hypothetical protein